MNMEIVCSADNNYVMPTGIMLTSLFENNKGIAVNIHLLDGGLTELNKSQLHDICEKYNQHISFYKMDEKLFEDFPMGETFQVKHINSMATYYRLYMSEVLPKDIDRVVYLDGDLIVTDSLLPMWNYNMQKKPIAAIPDPFNNEVKHYNMLRYPQIYGYFNAGVLLIDLKYWREHDCLGLFLEIVKKYKARLSSHDQDVLNVAFMNNKIFLPLRYNVMPAYLYQLQYNPLTWEFEEQMIEAQKHPAIIHFSYIPKPWCKDCVNPYKMEFEKYRSMTIWANYKEGKGLTYSKSLFIILKKLLVKMRLKQEESVEEYRYISLR